MSTPDWSDRHAASQHIIQFFSYEHLPAGAMRAVSARCTLLAEQLLLALPDGPELSAGMRKLLEAKDCFVRAALLSERSEDMIVGTPVTVEAIEP